MDFVTNLFHKIVDKDSSSHQKKNTQDTKVAPTFSNKGLLDSSVTMMEVDEPELVPCHSDWAPASHGLLETTTTMDIDDSILLPNSVPSENNLDGLFCQTRSNVCKPRLSVINNFDPLSKKEVGSLSDSFYDQLSGQSTDRKTEPVTISEDSFFTGLNFYDCETNKENIGAINNVMNKSGNSFDTTFTGNMNSTKLNENKNQIPEIVKSVHLDDNLLDSTVVLTENIINANESTDKNRNLNVTTDITEELNNSCQKSASFESINLEISGDISGFNTSRETVILCERNNINTTLEIKNSTSDISQNLENANETVEIKTESKNNSFVLEDVSQNNDIATSLNKTVENKTESENVVLNETMEIETRSVNDSAVSKYISHINKVAQLNKTVDIEAEAENAGLNETEIKTRSVNNSFTSDVPKNNDIVLNKTIEIKLEKNSPVPENIESVISNTVDVKKENLFKKEEIYESISFEDSLDEKTSKEIFEDAADIIPAKYERNILNETVELTEKPLNFDDIPIKPNKYNQFEEYPFSPNEPENSLENLVDSLNENTEKLCMDASKALCGNNFNKTMDTTNNCVPEESVLKENTGVLENKINNSNKTEIKPDLDSTVPLNTSDQVLKDPVTEYMKKISREILNKNEIPVLDCIITVNNNDQVSGNSGTENIETITCEIFNNTKIKPDLDGTISKNICNPVSGDSVTENIKEIPCEIVKKTKIEPDLDSAVTVNTSNQVSDNSAENIKEISFEKLNKIEIKPDQDDKITVSTSQVLANSAIENIETSCGNLNKIEITPDLDGTMFINTIYQISANSENIKEISCENLNKTGTIPDLNKTINVDANKQISGNSTQDIKEISFEKLNKTEITDLNSTLTADVSKQISGNCTDNIGEISFEKLNKTDALPDLNNTINVDTNKQISGNSTQNIQEISFEKLNKTNAVPDLNNTINVDVNKQISGNSTQNIQEISFEKLNKTNAIPDLNNTINVDVNKQISGNSTQNIQEISFEKLNKTNAIPDLNNTINVDVNKQISGNSTQNIQEISFEKLNKTEIIPALDSTITVDVNKEISGNSTENIKEISFEKLNKTEIIQALDSTITVDVNKEISGNSTENIKEISFEKLNKTDTIPDRTNTITLDTNKQISGNSTQNIKEISFEKLNKTEIIPDLDSTITEDVNKQISGNSTQNIKEISFEKLNKTAIKPDLDSTITVDVNKQISGYSSENIKEISFDKLDKIEIKPNINITRTVETEKSIQPIDLEVQSDAKILINENQSKNTHSNSELLRPDNSTLCSDKLKLEERLISKESKCDITLKDNACLNKVIDMNVNQTINYDDFSSFLGEDKSKKKYEQNDCFTIPVTKQSILFSEDIVNELPQKQKLINTKTLNESELLTIKEEYKTIVKKLETELADSKQRENDLLKKLENQENKNTTATPSKNQEELILLRTNTHELTTENEMLKDKIKQLSQTNETTDILKDKVKQLSQTNETLEKTMARVMRESEQLMRERDLAQIHLSNAESAFSDVHQKYENLKHQVQVLKNRDEQYLREIAINEETIERQEKRYDALKTFAMGEIEKCNQEIITTKKILENENAKITAQMKRHEIKNNSLMQALQQKTKECEELSAAYDEMLGKV